MTQSVLASGVCELDISLPAGGYARLTTYLDLIEKWNRVYNLTAIRDRERMAIEHVLDSLSILPHIPAGPILDIGSGAGLPGIPLAIARPGWHVTLLDSNHKRCAFLRDAVIELGLANVTVACERIEAYRPDEAFAVIVSRAFSETQHFARAALPHLASGGIMLAMKGLFPHEELSQLPEGVAMRCVEVLRVPGLAAHRHLVIMTAALP